MSDSLHPILILSSSDVERVVSTTEPNVLVDLMRGVFTGLSINDPHTIASPLRSSIQTPLQTALFMPSRISTAGGTGIKVVSVPTQSSVDGLPATTMLLDDATGKVTAIVNARQLTALRNAAGSVLATQLIGPALPEHLTLFGAGAQIYHHARLFVLLYPDTIKSLTIINRSANERLAGLVARLQTEFPSVQIDKALLADKGLVKEAVNKADIIITATSSTEPLFETDWVKPNAHLNMIGSYKPNMHEVPTSLLSSSDSVRTILVDSLEACRAEAGELIAALDSSPSILNEKSIVEIGEYLQGRRGVEGKKGGRTIFKSVGVGLQDVAIAAEVVKKAKDLGLGTMVEYD